MNYIANRDQYFRKRYLIVISSNDEYELPINVFDNARDMSKHYQEKYVNVYSIVTKAFKNNSRITKYGKIDFVDVN